MPKFSVFLEKIQLLNALGSGPITLEAVINDSVPKNLGDFRLPDSKQLATSEISIRSATPKVSIQSHDSANITLNYSADVLFVHTPDPISTQILGTHHFDVTITIPKGQDQKSIFPSMLPEHTMKVTMRPVQN